MGSIIRMRAFSGMKGGETCYAGIILSDSNPDLGPFFKMPKKIGEP